MRARGVVLLALFSGLSACEDTTEVPGGPAAPRALEARYYNRAVYVTWELAPEWNGESFRVYSKRTSDAEYFLIAQVTNCRASSCAYTDVNVVANTRYQYYVAAVDDRFDVETPSDYAVEVLVPEPTPPPVPTGLEVIALDGALYARWSASSRSAADFSHYRFYQQTTQSGQAVIFFVGETDSEGFLDLRAENGFTYRYFVSAVDTLGHESAGSQVGEGTPRPDYQGEWIHAHEDNPDRSGFRFRASDSETAVLSGFSPQRHFRLEVDAAGWWLAPGPGTAIHSQGFITSALTCGVASDPDCSALTRAPSSGYVTGRVGLDAQTTYALRVIGEDGRTHYAAIRVVLLGLDQNGNALMIFDWAYQLQADNLALAPARSP